MVTKIHLAVCIGWEKLRDAHDCHTGPAGLERNIQKEMYNHT